jgi:hypothetical protein
MKSYLYKSEESAMSASKELGCKGTHKHKKAWMPCKTHDEFLKVTKTNKGELEELIDYDGTMSSSKIPILDPKVTNKGTNTMDKTVAMTRITQDPLTRGYRVYYGESVVREEDMADAFGFEETKFMDAEETINFFEKELGLEKKDAESRAEEMGKDEKIEQTSKYKKHPKFITKGRLVEKDVTEDTVLRKKDDLDIRSKENSASPILIRNVKALKRLANIEGVSLSELVKYLKNE